MSNQETQNQDTVENQAKAQRGLNVEDKLVTGGSPSLIQYADYDKAVTYASNQSIATPCFVAACVRHVMADRATLADVTEGLPQAAKRGRVGDSPEVKISKLLSGLSPKQKAAYLQACLAEIE